jgi:hypothetical protein
MQAAAHDPAFALSAGIKPKVAKEFNQADQMQKAGALRRRRKDRMPA